MGSAGERVWSLAGLRHRLKQCCRVDARYEKRAVNSLAMRTLDALLAWV